MRPMPDKARISYTLTCLKFERGLRIGPTKCPFRIVHWVVFLDNMSISNKMDIGCVWVAHSKCSNSVQTKKKENPLPRTETSKDFQKNGRVPERFQEDYGSGDPEIIAKVL